ncbi:hypothetical protein BDV39DRAFT_181965 [Aspergillus sergii]|uniref:Uncharacterized protein n=1 Tax=Aspergillus sergii TaxID=1034303 RepID=A0A5N6WU05_9EURO|nr:hypothetical protein BDV39DRAFT_181965 [Aspergillus sergii]
MYWEILHVQRPRDVLSPKVHHTQTSRQDHERTSFIASQSREAQESHKHNTNESTHINQYIRKGAMTFTL